MLVVLAIIAIMASSGAYFLAPKSAAVRQSSAIMGGIFQNARTAAVLKGAPTKILILDNAADPEKHHRYVVSVFWDETSASWQPLDRGVYLPDQVFFDPNQSWVVADSQSSPAMATFEWASTMGGMGGTAKSWYTFQFEPNGVMASSEAQIVLAAGRSLNPGEDPQLDDLKVAGFWMNRFGTPHYFDSKEGLIR